MNDKMVEAPGYVSFKIPRSSLFFKLKEFKKLPFVDSIMTNLLQKSALGVLKTTEKYRGIL
jgi:hypothetical protein